MANWLALYYCSEQIKVIQNILDCFGRKRHIFQCSQPTFFRFICFLISTTYNMEEPDKVFIIGAGISGLIAAKTLEEKGHEVVVLEQSNEVGGRLKTIDHNGVPLDLGFQVMLDE